VVPDVVIDEISVSDHILSLHCDVLELHTLVQFLSRDSFKPLLPGVALKYVHI
jgi:hypothetical protein